MEKKFKFNTAHKKLIDRIFDIGINNINDNKKEE